MTRSAHDFLMGGKVPAAKFDKQGAVASGRVISYENVQQRDMEGHAKVFDDGRPMMQLVITIETGDIDPTIENDDGVRRLYARGGRTEEGKEGKPMLDAIRDAVKASGWKGNLVDGILSVKFSDEGSPFKRGWSAPKLFRAKYDPPAAEVPFADAQPVVQRAADEPQHEDDGPLADFDAIGGDQEPF